MVQSVKKWWFAVVDTQLSDVLSGKLDQIVWRAAECRDHMRLVWDSGDGPGVLAHVYPLFANIVRSLSYID